MKGVRNTSEMVNIKKDDRTLFMHFQLAVALTFIKITVIYHPESRLKVQIDI